MKDYRSTLRQQKKSKYLMQQKVLYRKGGISVRNYVSGMDFHHLQKNNLNHLCQFYLEMEG